MASKVSLKRDARKWLKEKAALNIQEAADLHNYIKFLESEVKRLKEYSPYSCDNPTTNY